MFLEEDQKEVLERLQQDTGASVAEMVREAIDRFLKEKKKLRGKSFKDETIEKLLSVAGICKDGPPDLADNHDYYLYGLPKKRK